MYKPQVFHTISEHFPTRRTHAPRLDTESEQFYDELDRQDYNAAYLKLAASLDDMEYSQQLPRSERVAREMNIIADAQDLACRMLPEDAVDLLGLTPKQPDNIAFDADAPSLRGLYLLVHAYDRTHDAALRHAVEYIFSQTPPHLSELLGEAYSTSLAKGSAILVEYQKLANVQDDQLDGVPATAETTKMPDATQASGGKLGAAALRLRKN